MLFSKSKSRLGVDIGSANIKIAQVRPKDNQFILETYGMVNVSFQITSKESSSSVKETASILRNLMQKSGVTANKAVASLPNNSVFTSVIELPKMSNAELKTAVEFEAKKYVPLPLSEVALSWSNIEDKKGDKAAAGRARSKVLLTAVPTVVIENYVKVFALAGLEVEALEIEALALIRSLVGEESGNIILIDIGANITSVTLVDSGYLRLSKNLNVGGDTMTSQLSKSLSVNFTRAEQFKKDFGLSGPQAQIIQVMRPILDVIKNEVNQLVNLFESRGQKIDKIILSGGGSKLPSLKDYLAPLGKPIVTANPWKRVIYPQSLRGLLEPLGLNLAVAMGLAMRSST